MKKMFFAIMATVALLGTQSCKKETLEPVKSPVEALATTQANYQAESLTYNDFDMLNIVTGQAGNNNALPVIAEIEVNDIETDITQSRSSNMRPEMNGVPQPMLIKKVDANRVSLTFTSMNNSRMHAASSDFSNGTSLPNHLLQNMVFDFQSYGNGNGSWTFNIEKLNGIYTVETIATNGKPSGFTLTMETSTTKKIVLTLNNKLE
jgi:hypothetical protein